MLGLFGAKGPFMVPLDRSNAFMHYLYVKISSMLSPPVTQILLYNINLQSLVLRILYRKIKGKTFDAPDILQYLILKVLNMYTSINFTLDELVEMIIYICFKKLFTRATACERVCGKNVNLHLKVSC